MSTVTTRTELPEWLKAAVGMIDQQIDQLAERERRQRRRERAARGAGTTPFPYLEATMDHNEAA